MVLRYCYYTTIDVSIVHIMHAASQQRVSLEHTSMSAQTNRLPYIIIVQQVLVTMIPKPCYRGTNFYVVNFTLLAIAMLRYFFTLKKLMKIS